MNRLQTNGNGGLHIQIQTVANHQGFSWRNPEPFAGQFKHARVRLGETDIGIARNQNRLKEILEPRGTDRGALHVTRAVGQDRFRQMCKVT